MLVEEVEPPPALRARLMSIVEMDRRQWLEQQSSTQAAVPPVTGTAPPPDQARPAQQGESILDKVRSWLNRTPRLALGGGALALAIVVVVGVFIATRNTTTVLHTYACAVPQRTVNGVDYASTGCTVTVRSDHSIELAFNSLPQLARTKAYELWGLPATGAPVPVAGFVAGTGGAFSHTYKVDATRYAKAAVTIEQAPGDSPAPHGPIVFVLPLKG